MQENLKRKFLEGCLRKRIGLALGWATAAGIVAALLIIGWARPAGAFSDIPNQNTWVTNGDVYAVVTDGTTVYIGGHFSQVGLYTGYGVPLDASTGSPEPVFPKVNGPVYAVVPDGSGGWYIGGYFTKVGSETRNSVAHILSDGTVDPAWDPNADSDVYALAVSGSTVYAGGDFTNIGGQPRNYIAALDDTNGTATAWDPDADSDVYSLAVSGSTVYAGGYFTYIGGQTRNYIAALDDTNGTVDPLWDPNADGVVFTLAVSGSTVYAGGDFTYIGGQTRNYIAALDDTNGTATAWNPNADSDVFTLAVSGSTVYAGGYFTSIGGQLRNYIAALDDTNGTATAWDPNADDVVFTLAVSGSTVYAGGDFTNIGDQPRSKIAALDALTGNATAWNPGVQSVGEGDTPQVMALAVTPDHLYVGGAFTSIGGEPQPNFAQFDGPTLAELLSFKAKGARDHIQLKWETGSELQTAGFHLWRAAAGKGSFFRITDALIPSQGEPFMGADYSFEDYEVRPGKTYRYKLEGIDMDASSSFHGPVKGTVGAIRLVAPDNKSAVKKASPPQFVWESIGFDRFKIQLSTRADFRKKRLTLAAAQGNDAGKGDWIPDSDYTPTKAQWKDVRRLLGKRVTLYWRVVGKTRYGTSFTSQANELKIEQ